MTAWEEWGDFPKGVVPGKSTRIKWMAPHHPHMGNIDWTQWVIKKRRKKNLKLGERESIKKWEKIWEELWEGVGLNIIKILCMHV